MSPANASALRYPDHYPALRSFSYKVYLKSLVSPKSPDLVLQIFAGSHVEANVTIHWNLSQDLGIWTRTLGSWDLEPNLGIWSESVTLLFSAIIFRVKAPDSNPLKAIKGTAAVLKFR